eukprot:TRINITY_DN322_c0_g1_i6.p3 TRINITY_DN322_c0_g1~~TRINITY_DN322_c0_g1_i6.p3  ORF type:complete len:183 (-),score=77.05 TRINITY_DN322_c0_g1_i6:783-1253(-)
MPFSSGFLAFSLADFSIVRSGNTARSFLPQKSVENGAKIAPNTPKNGENGDNEVQNGVQNGDSGVQIPAWLVFAAKKWAKGGGNCRNRCVGEGKNGIMVAARVRMISDDKITIIIDDSPSNAGHLVFSARGTGLVVSRCDETARAIFGENPDTGCV